MPIQTVLHGWVKRAANIAPTNPDERDLLGFPGIPAQEPKKYIRQLRLVAENDRIQYPKFLDPKVRDFAKDVDKIVNRYAKDDGLRYDALQRGTFLEEESLELLEKKGYGEVIWGRESSFLQSSEPGPSPQWETDNAEIKRMVQYWMAARIQNSINASRDGRGNPAKAPNRGLIIAQVQEQSRQRRRPQQHRQQRFLKRNRIDREGFDSDHGPAKAKPKKLELSKHHITKQSGMLAMDVDGPIPAAPAGSRHGRSADKKIVKKPTHALVDSESGSKVFAAVAKKASNKKKLTEDGRTIRDAAHKTSNYAVDADNESDEIRDEFDVGMLVRTIGASGNDRPLFPAPAARSTSVTGAASKLNGRATARKPRLIGDDDLNETNYEALAQGSAVKPNQGPAMFSDISDDDLLLCVKKKASLKAIPKGGHLQGRK